MPSGWDAIWAPIAAEDDWSLFDGKLEAIAELRGALDLTPG